MPPSKAREWPWPTPRTSWKRCAKPVLSTLADRASWSSCKGSSLPRRAQAGTLELVQVATPVVADGADELEAFGYCTNFLITGAGIPFEQVRAAIAAMGQSAVIVGDDEHIKVHLHTENPGKALDLAVRYGSLSQIKIDNMDSQILERPRHATQASSGIAVLTVASGAGIAKAFRSVGVASVIDGGQTMNPSIEELLRAVDSAPGQEVILLPNNSNLLMAAQQVPALASRTVRVVPTRSIARGWRQFRHSALAGQLMRPSLPWIERRNAFAASKSPGRTRTRRSTASPFDAASTSESSTIGSMSHRTTSSKRR